MANRFFFVFRTLDSSTRTEERLQNSKNKSSSFDKTIFLLDPSPPQNKITKWLETLDYPLFKPA